MKNLIPIILSFILLPLLGQSNIKSAESLPIPRMWIMMPDGLTYTLQQLNDQHDIVILVSNISIIPNPVRSNQRARVAYELPIQMDVKIIITSMQGKTIRVENLGNRKAGKYTYQLDPTGLASGMYNCTFLANGARVTKRFIVTR